MPAPGLIPLLGGNEGIGGGVGIVFPLISPPGSPAPPVPVKTGNRRPRKKVAAYAPFSASPRWGPGGTQTWVPDQAGDPGCEASCQLARTIKKQTSPGSPAPTGDPEKRLRRTRPSALHRDGAPGERKHGSPIKPGTPAF